MRNDKENVLLLASYGFCSETIHRVYPEVTKSFIDQNARPKDRWRERKIPSKLFSAVLDDNTLLKRQFCVLPVMRYFELQSPLRALNFNNVDRPKGATLTLKLAKKMYRKVSPENEDKEIHIDLYVLGRAYFMALDGFFQDYPRAIPTINEILSIVEGIYAGEFFILNCACGRPVLAENRPCRNAKGEFRRNFFLCPWCGTKNHLHNEDFERELEKHSNYVGLITKG